LSSTGDALAASAAPTASPLPRNQKLWSLAKTVIHLITSTASTPISSRFLTPNRAIVWLTSNANSALSVNTVVKKKLAAKATISGLAASDSAQAATPRGRTRSTVKSVRNSGQKREKSKMKNC
jgi:hypothetical protein